MRGGLAVLPALLILTMLLVPSAATAHAEPRLHIIVEGPPGEYVIAVYDADARCPLYAHTVSAELWVRLPPGDYLVVVAAVPPSAEPTTLAIGNITIRIAEGAAVYSSWVSASGAEVEVRARLRPIAEALESLSLPPSLVEGAERVVLRDDVCQGLLFGACFSPRAPGSLTVKAPRIPLRIQVLANGTLLSYLLLPLPEGVRAVPVPAERVHPLAASVSSIVRTTSPAPKAARPPLPSEAAGAPEVAPLSPKRALKEIGLPLFVAGLASLIVYIFVRRMLTV